LELIDPEKVGVCSLIARRSSQANFSTKELSSPQIIQLLQAARCAPSSHNSQPWHFIVLRKGPIREAINQTLTQSGAAWAIEAPVLIGITINQEQATHQNGLNYALFDTGLATQNMLLQATSMGLAAHPVNYYDPDVVREALNLPIITHDLIMFLAVGHPSDEEVDTESTSLRKPLAKIAAWETWGGEPLSE